MIRKAVGSYGEALYLSVFLSFANKSQVARLSLSRHLLNLHPDRRTAKLVCKVLLHATV